MVTQSNFGKIWDELTHSRTSEGAEWKILGQEQDKSIIIGWFDASPELKTCIGVYNHECGTLETLHTIKQYTNIVQATVNLSKTLLGYVIKEKPNNSDVTTEEVEVDSGSTKEVYSSFIVEVSSANADPRPLTETGPRQTMVQFLYKTKDSKLPEKLLVLIHQDSISLCTVAVEGNGDGELKISGSLCLETVVRTFSWAQWDTVNQSLYYIHYRKSQLSVEGDDTELRQEEELSPTLSCLQFHDEMPHETVLNIPLNLPQLPTGMESACSTYEDDPVPLRIHDCSLDLQVVTDPKGVVCICHHYLYQNPCQKLLKIVLDELYSIPSEKKWETEDIAVDCVKVMYKPVKAPISEVRSNTVEPSGTVHFAYSVTLLHHGCVIHFTAPGILWSQARSMKPSFVLHGDQHMVVYAPGLFTHLLDIGLNHEPCCHILMNSDVPGVPTSASHMVPLLGSHTMVDLPTLDIVELSIPTVQLVNTFKSDQSLDNRLSILHYLLVHLGDLETVAELLSHVHETPLGLDVPQILQEALIGGAYAFASRNMSSDTASLVALLPLTTMGVVSHIEVKTSRLPATLNQETLWNTAMMLLSPQQRVVPYRVDMWTRLWDQLARKTSKEKTRFKPSQVAEKLMVSLVCYQVNEMAQCPFCAGEMLQDKIPEALSRSSTPLSPGGSLVGSGALADISNRKGPGLEILPFYEVESCTASKQEHVISVNLRELSMHLLKHSVKQTPMNVHIIATRYVAAQLEISKHLCMVLSQCASVDPYQEQERGFALVDQLEEGRRRMLFSFLERYFFAVEAMAFPVPQGFTSFFTYLGYQTLSFDMFVQYLQHSVFELQVDVMKIIMADTDDTKEGVKKKLRLLSFLPRSRAKRLLNQWSHPVSLMLRAREHALNILSGVEGTQARGHPSQRSRTPHSSTRGLAAFPSADRLSPLDTFLDLLTAKASLNELDFGLLIEATVTSTEEFL